MPHITIPTFITFCSFCILIVSGHSIQAQPPALVEVDEVRIQPLAQSIPFTAQLVEKQSGVVASRMNGPVEKIYVEVGDRVKAGSLIAKLDDSLIKLEGKRLKASLNEAQAQVDLSEAEGELRKQELRRLERLRKSVAFPKSNYEDAQQKIIISRKSIRVALARKEASAADLDLNKLQLEWTQVIAPFSGVITEIFTERGSWLSTGQNVAYIINDKDIEVSAAVPADRIASLSPGMVAPLILEDGTRHKAIIRAILPKENAATRTRQVLLTPYIEKIFSPLATGQSVTIEIPIGQKEEAVTVHKDAVVRLGGRSFVYVALSGMAQLRPVTTGSAINNRFRVLGGLGAGELVVIRGNERLQPGQSIKISNEAQD
tara:strand:- start:36817 stop:37935 length:1119 start_codon:yes stop_codon:yes gene_type:complete